MTNRNSYPPPFEKSERTAVLERDLYHLDSRLNDLTSTVDAAHTRLYALSERIRRAEWQLDATTSSLATLQQHTTTIGERMPDIEAMLRVVRWVLDSLKYVIGAAILAGAWASGQAVDVLKLFFAG